MRVFSSALIVLAEVFLLGGLQACSATAPKADTTSEAVAPLNYPTRSLVGRRDKSLPSNVKVIDGEHVGRGVAGMPQATGSGPGGGR